MGRLHRGVPAAGDGPKGKIPVLELQQQHSKLLSPLGNKTTLTRTGKSNKIGNGVEGGEYNEQLIVFPDAKGINTRWCEDTSLTQRWY